jgi:hypothetical protein
MAALIGRVDNWDLRPQAMRDTLRYIAGWSLDERGMQRTCARIPASEFRYWTKRMPGWGACVAVSALAPYLLLLCPGQAMASPSAGPRPAPMPQWIPLSIDHPTPLGSPLPAALTTASTVRGTVIGTNQARAVLSAV